MLLLLLLLGELAGKLPTTTGRPSPNQSGPALPELGSNEKGRPVWIGRPCVRI
ncbi:MAG UNVERIFIED_CONTAM: hypothetical protein LVR18_02575 [Planctomycetaceae bacterium]|jgi:hypothetical protein